MLQVEGIKRNKSKFRIELSISAWESEDEVRITLFIRDVTERMVAENMLIHYNFRLENLRTIDRAILSAQSPQAIAHAVLKHLKQLMPLARASVSLYDFGVNKIEIIAESWDEEGNLLGDQDTFLLMEQYPINQTLLEGKLLRVDNIKDLPKQSQMVQALSEHGIQSFMRAPLLTQDGLLGVLNLGAGNPKTFTSEHEEIAREVADSLAVALQQAKLFEQIEVGRVQLQLLSRKLVNVQETERRHLALELHDEIGQILTGLKYTIEMCLRWPDKIDPANLVESEKLVDELITCIQEISLRLRPTVLDDLGLLPALLWHFGRYSTQTGVEVEFKHRGLKQRFTPQLETTSYRIVQEGLTNIARHAKVKEVTVQVTNAENHLTIQIRDEGSGFDPESSFSSRESSGLIGMRERALMVGGQLIVESTPGLGCLIKAELPLKDRIERRSRPR
ncbi:MAG: GAF domain-containing sensor histidine kinase [Chloroflexi bacterium]|nr:GAF domain-containing sensor histidine kinase [Chloroflexota bacterium]